MNNRQPKTFGFKGASLISKRQGWRARTARARSSESVEPVVDRDLLTLADGAPREHLDAAAHRVRIAGVVEVAARRQQHCAALEVELGEVAPIIG